MPIKCNRLFWSFLISILMIISHQAFAQTYSVILKWDASSDTNVVGYRVYYGPSSRGYTNSIVAGNVTNATVGNLQYGTVYYFAATSYNGAGWESAYSTEVEWVMTAPGATPEPISSLRVQSWLNNGASYSLTLAWTPSQDSSVTGVRIYKAVETNGTLGAYKALPAIPIPAANLNVSNLATGVTTFFYADSFNSSGVQSPASNKISVYEPAGGGNPVVTIFDSASGQIVSSSSLNGASGGVNAISTVDGSQGVTVYLIGAEGGLATPTQIAPLQVSSPGNWLILYKRHVTDSWSKGPLINIPNSSCASGVCSITIEYYVDPAYPQMFFQALLQQ